MCVLFRSKLSLSSKSTPPLLPHHPPSTAHQGYLDQLLSTPSPFLIIFYHFVIIIMCVRSIYLLYNMPTSSSSTKKNKKTLNLDSSSTTPSIHPTHAGPHRTKDTELEIQFPVSPGAVMPPQKGCKKVGANVGPVDGWLARGGGYRYVMRVETGKYVLRWWVSNVFF